MPQLEIVDAAAAADGLALDHDHGHHHGHAHNEPAPDPHIWLSPRRAPQLLEAIAAALIRARPELRPHIESVLPELLARFTALDREIASLLRGASRPVVVHHPSFGYLSADYGLETLVVERAGLSPTPAYLARVMDEITARGARGLVVQPQFADGQVRKAARVLGLEVVDLDPLARDLPANLRLMATRLGRLAGAGRSPR